ncbi:MAG: hypothetical protein FD188_3595 [Ignavibacteria bacterium]|nr:MAG: hypothetical protein FD188_3595 [Ignavibacteria bacterium]
MSNFAKMKSAQIKRKHSTYIGRLLKRLRAKRHVHQKELIQKFRSHHNRLSSKSNTAKAMPNLITREMANMLTAGGKLVAARLLQPVTVIAGPDGTLSLKTNPGNEGSGAEKIHCTYIVGIRRTSCITDVMAGVIAMTEIMVDGLAGAIMIVPDFAIHN